MVLDISNYIINSAIKVSAAAELSSNDLDDMSPLEPIINLADEGLNIPNVDFERRISEHQQNKSDSRVEVQSDEHIPIVYTSNVLEQIHNGSDLLHNNTFRSLSTMELERGYCFS